MTELDVAVLVPVFNGARFLAETLQSVDDQTYHRLAIVICDDASTDESRRIARDFAGTARHPVRIVEHAGNLGVQRALASCLDAATGVDAVIFFAQDDLLPPEYVAQVAATFASSGAVAVQTCATTIDEDGRPTRGRNAPYAMHVLGRLATALLLGRNGITGTGTMVRRSELTAERVLGAEPLCHDWEMWIRLSLAGPFVTCLSTRSTYRVRSDSLSRSASTAEHGRQIDSMRLALSDSGLVSGYLDSLRPWQRKAAVALAAASARTSQLPGSTRDFVRETYSRRQSPRAAGSSRERSQWPVARSPWRAGLGSAQADPRARGARLRMLASNSAWVGRSNVGLVAQLARGWVANVSIRAGAGQPAVDGV